jgi:hypothetical protein
MDIVSETYIDNVKVEKGARIRVHTNLDRGITFSFEAVCQDDKGHAWIGIGRLGSEVIVETEVLTDHFNAAHEAERLVLERLAALLRG